MRPFGVYYIQCLVVHERRESSERLRLMNIGFQKQIRSQSRSSIDNQLELTQAIPLNNRHTISS